MLRVVILVAAGVAVSHAMDLSTTTTEGAPVSPRMNFIIENFGEKRSASYMIAMDARCNIGDSPGVTDRDLKQQFLKTMREGDRTAAHEFEKMLKEKSLELVLYYQSKSSKTWKPLTGERVLRLNWYKHYARSADNGVEAVYLRYTAEEITTFDCVIMLRKKQDKHMYDRYDMTAEPVMIDLPFGITIKEIIEKFLDMTPRKGLAAELKEDNKYLSLSYKNPRGKKTIRSGTVLDKEYYNKINPTGGYKLYLYLRTLDGEPRTGHRKNAPERLPQGMQLLCSTGHRKNPPGATASGDATTLGTVKKRKPTPSKTMQLRWDSRRARLREEAVRLARRRAKNLAEYDRFYENMYPNPTNNNRMEMRIGGWRDERLVGR